MKKLHVGLALLVVGMMLAAAGCRQPEVIEDKNGKVTPPPATDGGGEGVGQAVPSFTLTDVDGKSHSPGDYKGRILVVDFWATYCKPCVKKLGEYSLDETYRNRDVAILALSMDDSDEVIRGWRKRQGDEFTVPLARLDDKTRKAFFGDVAIVPIPQVRVVDRAGIVRYSFGADSTAEELREAVKTLLAEK